LQIVLNWVGRRKLLERAGRKPAVNNRKGRGEKISPVVVASQILLSLRLALESGGPGQQQRPRLVQRRAHGRAGQARLLLEAE